MSAHYTFDPNRDCYWAHPVDDLEPEVEARSTIDVCRDYAAFAQEAVYWVLEAPDPYRIGWQITRVTGMACDSYAAASERFDSSPLTLWAEGSTYYRAWWSLDADPEPRRAMRKWLYQMASHLAAAKNPKLAVYQWAYSCGVEVWGTMSMRDRAKLLGVTVEAISNPSHELALTYGFESNTSECPNHYFIQHVH